MKHSLLQSLSQTSYIVIEFQFIYNKIGKIQFL